ncbi:MAG: hypothetical protein KDH96_07545 [Candidatus Riesia sp.]|nr:hypothetical protein [Candidatus Riesia sp.]
MLKVTRVHLDGQMRILQREESRSGTSLRVISLNHAPERVLSLDEGISPRGTVIISQRDYLQLKDTGLISPISKVRRGILVEVLF